MSLERLALLRHVSREAGSCLAEFFGSKLTVKKKGILDLVTQADETAERLIVDAIQASFPQDAIFAEEGGSKTGDSGYEWIIDPLDGTTNFTHGFPHFSVSAALAHDGEVIAGVVFDPIKDEWFEAVRGEGATCNGQPLGVGDAPTLDETLAVTGFSYDRRERMDELLNRVRLLLSHCRGMRRLGSAALDLAYIAAGRFDLYIEDGLNAWDIAAGQLLVTEAGGVVRNFAGGPLNLHEGAVLAANPTVADLALQRLFA